MIDRTQLLRLLDEAHAVLTPIQIAEMSISMDVTEVNLKAMLDEATAEWEAVKDAHAAPADSKAAQHRLSILMRKYSDFGAQDSEGLWALERVRQAAEDGKPFPLVVKAWPHDNPFELYESVAGWEVASAELVAAAEDYWKTLLQEKLGVSIA